MTRGSITNNAAMGGAHTYRLPNAKPSRYVAWLWIGVFNVAGQASIGLNMETVAVSGVEGVVG